MFRFFVGLGVSNITASGVAAGVGSGVGSGIPVLLCKYFIGNILLLELLRIFLLPWEITLIKKDLLSTGILPLFISLNLLTNLLCSSSASFSDTFSTCVSLKEQ